MVYPSHSAAVIYTPAGVMAASPSAAESGHNIKKNIGNKLVFYIIHLPV